MAREKICGVYKITSPSGKFYIGSSVDIHNRWWGHKSDLINNKHHSPPLQNAANKHGVDNLIFEVIEVCDFSIVRDVEQKYLDELNPEYNASKCTKEYLTEAWKNPEFRKKGIDRVKKQAAEWRKDPNWIEKQRIGASKALSKLHENPDFKLAHIKRATDRINKVNINQDLKEKAAIGRRARMALDKTNPIVWNKRNEKIRELLFVKVLCVETGVIFNSHREAGEWLKSEYGFKSSGHISNAIAGRVKKAYGYHWEKA